MSRLGIMQGRLVPPEPDRFQAFPKVRWLDEFSLARLVPLSCIEWIYDLYGADVNPITNAAEFTRFRHVIEKTGVRVHSMCGDYFMDQPFLRCSPAECEDREQFLHHLIRHAHAAGIERIVLPFVDASRIDTSEDRDTVIRVLQNALPAVRETGIELHLETSLEPSDFARLLDRIPDPAVKVNYDSGNSSSLGYTPSEEFRAYGHRIGSIHIKDRIRGGGTVPLGTGNADFPAVFRSMEAIGYGGDIILQVARPEPGNEVAWARQNRAFIANYWPLE